jgi:hypothetical protein
MKRIKAESYFTSEKAHKVASTWKKRYSKVTVCKKVTPIRVRKESKKYGKYYYDVSAWGTKKK